MGPADIQAKRSLFVSVSVCACQVPAVLAGNDADAVQLRLGQLQDGRRGRRRRRRTADIAQAVLHKRARVLEESDFRKELKDGRTLHILCTHGSAHTVSQRTRTPQASLFLCVCVSLSLSHTHTQNDTRGEPVRTVADGWLAGGGLCGPLNEGTGKDTRAAVAPALRPRQPHVHAS
jgi:hypothetical protein